MAEVDFDPLLSLLKASSKEVVVRLSNEAYLLRSSNQIPGDVVKKTTEALGIDQKESYKLILALGGLIKKSLFLSSSEPGPVLALFPDNFHKNLKELLTKVILDNLNNWRNRAISSQVSLPRLLDFDWRVDTKMSSDAIARMSIPTCILQMQVQDPPLELERQQETSTLNVELSKETIETMLDGLGKIRDQLSSVTKK
ncbi:COMM domain-containing protein 9-like [Lineus longissimus]|uniref:COMM domain-containing protein 9-like n=1 Tax=Lineus longissimus TaxID=88925 RepID=UPI002B4E135B